MLLIVYLARPTRIRSGDTCKPADLITESTRSLYCKPPVRRIAIRPLPEYVYGVNVMMYITFTALT
jgi:hypothetical protein